MICFVKSYLAASVAQVLGVQFFSSLSFFSSKYHFVANNIVLVEREKSSVSLCKEKIGCNMVV